MPNSETCKTCHKPVSSTALMCPYCGELNPRVDLEKFVKVVLAIGAVAFVLIFGVVLWGEHEHPTNSAGLPTAQSSR